MTDAPEKIWVQHRTCTVDASGASRLLAMDRQFAGGTAHIPFDLHLALVAAAYLDAANLHQSLWRETTAYKTDQIIKRTPADAQAALEKVKREARNEAIEQAILAVNGCDRVSEVQPALRKLMEDTDDE